MATYAGHKGVVQVGSDVVGEVESFDLEVSTNELERNVLGNDWTDVAGGQKTATGTINCIADSGDTAQSALVEGATVSLTLQTEGATTGLEEITFSALVTSSSRSADAGDFVKRTFSFRNKGTVTFGTVS
jgi:hypothetical protein